MKPINKILLFIIVILIILLFTKTNSNTIEKFGQMELLEKQNRKFPFRYFRDENDNVLPIVSISGFFRGIEQVKLYDDYINNGIKVIGITAYKTFPLKITDVSEDKFHHLNNFDYLNQINNWLCCFKNKYSYGLTDKHNIIDISESDFYNVDDTPTPQKKYDFIYICNKDDDKCNMNGWNAINRNFKLALDCFPIMINKFKLKGLIVGRVNCKLEQIYGDMVEITDFLPWHELQNKMRESKFLFLPNIYDASPRVIAECLTKGLPILMNENITCGFKYIDYDTGEFFNDEKDIEQALIKLLAKMNKISPKKWWSENYGVERTGVKLRNYLYNIYPEIIKNIKQVKFII